MTEGDSSQSLPGLKQSTITLDYATLELDLNTLLEQIIFIQFRNCKAGDHWQDILDCIIMNLTNILDGNKQQVIIFYFHLPLYLEESQSKFMGFAWLQNSRNLNRASLAI